VGYLPVQIAVFKIFFYEFVPSADKIFRGFGKSIGLLSCWNLVFLLEIHGELSGNCWITVKVLFS